jgi:hypothetical protein
MLMSMSGGLQRFWWRVSNRILYLRMDSLHQRPQPNVTRYSILLYLNEAIEELGHEILWLAKPTISHKEGMHELVICARASVRHAAARTRYPLSVDTIAVNKRFMSSGSDVQS